MRIVPTNRNQRDAPMTVRRGRGDWCQNIDLYHGLIIDNKYGGFGEADIIQSEPERTLTD